MELHGSLDIEEHPVGYERMEVKVQTREQKAELARQTQDPLPNRHGGKHGPEGVPQSRPSVAQRTMDTDPYSCRKRPPVAHHGKSISGRGRSRGVRSPQRK